jgi:hypothetical protein
VRGGEEEESWKSVVLKHTACRTALAGIDDGSPAEMPLLDDLSMKVLMQYLATV